VRLTLTEGDPLSGAVLPATGREVAIGWNEVRGVLELKGSRVVSVGRPDAPWASGSRRGTSTTRGPKPSAPGWGRR
jgi:hypothetical protein